jgi:hypothetical protein
MGVSQKADLSLCTQFRFWNERQQFLKCKGPIPLMNLIDSFSCIQSISLIFIANYKVRERKKNFKLSRDLLLNEAPKKTGRRQRVATAVGSRGSESIV